MLERTLVCAATEVVLANLVIYHFYFEYDVCLLEDSFLLLLNLICLSLRRLRRLKHWLRYVIRIRNMTRYDILRWLRLRREYLWMLKGTSKIYFVASSTEWTHYCLLHEYLWVNKSAPTILFNAICSKSACYHMWRRNVWARLNIWMFVSAPTIYLFA